MTARSALPLLLLILVSCTSSSSRLERANERRLAKDPRGALADYKVILADLGEGPLVPGDAQLRLKALRGAGDVSYLELGDYTGAISYYRRIISTSPGTDEALQARIVIGDIYKDRFSDRMAAIAQYADVAAGDSSQAPTYELEVAKDYLELKNYDQARTEARILRSRWPTHALAEDAQLLTAQAWWLEHHDEEAISAYQALIDSRPRPEIAARAREGEAQIYAESGRFNRALELYTRALTDHPNPEAIRTAIAAVRERRNKAAPSAPGDRDAAFDHQKARAQRRETQ